MTFGDPHFVTKDGLARIKKELQELKSVRRPEVVKKIETAKELGDLAENAEYHDAKDELAFIDGHLQKLEDIVAHASIIDEKTTGTRANIGSTVLAKINGREVKYKIVGANEADPKAGLISNESPLGMAILGKQVGDEIKVKTPSGEIHYSITKIE